jgi:antigen flippase
MCASDSTSSLGRTGHAFVKEVASSSSILKKTALIGGANIVGGGLRLIRMKAFALLLGPAGIGLAGLYDSILSTTGTISGMGVSTSGVRQVAEAAGTEDNRRTDRAVLALRWITILLAFAGALCLFFSRAVVSVRTFGNLDQAIPVAILSVGVFFFTVSNSQTAILSGFRRVHDLARITVISSFVGSIVAIAIVWSAGGRGLVYAVVGSVAITTICSWWFVRRAHHATSKPSWPELQAEGTSLLRLGFAFMLAGVTMTATLMLTRILILKHCGLAQAGYFQAGWGIAVFHIDFILSAMSVDFYPSLAAHINDRPKVNSLVNQQTEVALLLGGPLIVGMISFSPLLIRLLYSAQFASSAGLLRWLALGSILKLVAWPLGFIVMARGWGMVFLLTEVLWAFVFLGGVDVGTRHFGFTAAGYAFAGSYLFYVLLMYFITHGSVGFVWTRSNLALIGVLLLACFVATGLAGSITGYFVGAAMTLGLGAFSFWRIWGARSSIIVPRADTSGTI